MNKKRTKPLPTNHYYLGVHYFNINEYGDWRINENNQMIPIHKIKHLFTKDREQIINHSEVCWKGMDNPEAEQIGLRYEECDISYPCILLKDVINPKNLKYRLIDGRNRMAKMKAQNINESKFYVLKYDEIEKYIVPSDYHRIEKLKKILQSKKEI